MTSVSRRTVARGAAWAVPVVAVGAAAPAMAASKEFLTFTGNACKLPGNSDSVYKGYVFELVANNPYPDNVALVVTSVKIGGVVESVYGVKTLGGCTDCGCSTPEHEVCIPGSAVDLKVLILTGANPTGHSSNTSMDITYAVHTCGNGCSQLQQGADSSGVRSTPPTHGSHCHITGY